MKSCYGFVEGGGAAPTEGFTATGRQTLTVLKFFPLSKGVRRFDALPQKCLHCELVAAGAAFSQP